MKIKNLEIKIQELAYDELSEEIKQLIDKAKEATNNAYSKYSNFSVGAAVRLEDGSLYIGANQENAAYPSGLCAERSAIFGVQSQSPEKAITHLAIAAKNADGFLKQPISPCGSCRQVILEIEDRYKNDIKIYLYGEEKIYAINSGKDLLPLCFMENSMYE